MAFNKFMDKAKKAASEMVDANTAAHTMDQVQRAAHAAYETAGKALDFSREKAGQALDSIFAEINGLLPILHTCGFAMTDLQFAICVPPEFVMIIEHTGQAKTSLSQMLAERKETLSRLQEMVLLSLIKANELAVITQRYGYVFGQYELEINLSPKVIIHLVSDKSQPALPASLPQPAQPGADLP